MQVTFTPAMRQMQVWSRPSRAAAPSLQEPCEVVELRGGTAPVATERTLRGAALAAPLKPAAVPTTLVAGLQPVSEGFRSEIAHVDGSLPHTIHDLEGYLGENLGAETLQAVRQSGAPFAIAVGEGQASADQLTAAGWQIGSPVDKKVGFHKVNQAVTPEGTPAYLVWRVNGDDRVLHLQSMLKLVGLTGDRITTMGTTTSFKEDYLRRFRQLGQPDLVVYGMAKTAASALLKQHPIRNARHLYDVFRRRGAPKVDDTPTCKDLAGLKMEVMKLKNGQTIWFIPPLYGDLSRDVVDALLEHGAKKLHFIGTCGALNPAFKVGEVVTPSSWIGADGTAQKLDFLAPTAGARPGASYMRVSTPNIETREWAETGAREGVDIIEVELGYWLEAVRRRPDVQLRVQAVVSDVLIGPNARDMTRWDWTDAAATHDQIVTGIKDAMKNDDFRVASYEAVHLAA